jgi:hypothetical protein
VRALGADEAIDYRTDDVAARVRALTGGRGVEAVVDTVGPDSATAHLGLLVHGGGLAAVAGRPDLTAVPPFTTAPSVHEIALGAAHSHGDLRARTDLSVMLTELLTLVADGRLDPMLNRTVPLEEVPAALTELSDRHVRGKLVAVPGTAAWHRPPLLPPAPCRGGRPAPHGPVPAGPERRSPADAPGHASAPGRRPSPLSARPPPTPVRGSP